MVSTMGATMRAKLRERMGATQRTTLGLTIGFTTRATVGAKWQINDHSPINKGTNISQRICMIHTLFVLIKTDIQCPNC